MIVYRAFLKKKLPFKQYLGKPVKIQQPKKPETRTKVDFLLERANILSKNPDCKTGQKVRKSQLLRQNLTHINKKEPLLGQRMERSISISLIHFCKPQWTKTFCDIGRLELYETLFLLAPVDSRLFDVQNISCIIVLLTTNRSSIEFQT